MKPLSKTDFIKKMQIAPVNLFSTQGLDIIYNYLTSYDGSNYKEIISNPDEIREVFSESYFEEILEFFGIDWQGLSEADKKSLAINYLSKETKVLGATNIGTIVFQIF
jgi:hypothetical protein